MATTEPSHLEKVWRPRIFIESILLAVLGVLVIASSVISDQRDDAQDRERDRQFAEFRTCITTNFGDLASALKVARSLTEPRSESVGDLVDAILAAKGDQVKAQKAVTAYEKKNKELRKTAEETPYPDFPKGTCEEAEK